MDLAFAYRIDMDPDRLVVNDPTPTGNPMLDGTLAKVAAQDRATDTRTWIRILSVEDAPGICEQVLESFSLDHSELVLSSDVSDAVRGNLTIDIDAHPGEPAEVEVEEAYVQTLPGAGLPGGLSLKAGRAL